MTKGRLAKFIEFTLPQSGHTVRVRKLSPDVTVQIRSAVMAELQDEKPRVPTQRLEVAPGDFQDVENPEHPDYQKALKAWQDSVLFETGRRFMRLIGDYAVQDETDLEAVQEYRDQMAALGVEETSTDREVFLWKILAPTREDQRALSNFLVGASIPSAQEVQTARDSFRG